MRCAVLLGLTAMTAAAGCSWHRIPVAPTYERQDRITAVCGIDVSKNATSQTYGPRIAEQLRQWHVFDSVVHPYRDGDEVDAVLSLTVDGTWHASEGENFGRGFLIGLTLFTLSPVVGAKMDGEFSASATVSDRNDRQFTCDATRKLDIEFGLGADTDAVARNAEDSLIKQLAYDLAECLHESWIGGSRSGEQ